MAEGRRPVSETNLVSSWTPEGEPKPDEAGIIAAISTVYDPEIAVNIYELGLIYAIEIGDDGAVKGEMTLTAPGCPRAQELPVIVHDAIMAVPPVTACYLYTVWDLPLDPSRM